ncbi:MAG: alanine racemase [Sandaracinaceae bacterium]|nr:alanine racemase [Sandaracinaceae bacterium]
MEGRLTLEAPRALDELPTPCLLLERARLARNCERMRARTKALGVRLRPHLKTSKSLDVANAILGDGPRGGTVSTLEEAAYFVERGLTDLVYAVPIVPAKLERAAALGVAVITDDAGVASAIARRADALGASFDVYVELDTGHHRTGVDPEGPELIAITNKLASSPRVRLRGVLTHAGQSYACRSIEAVRAVAEDERRLAVLAAERLRAAGHAAPEVSVGSTPGVTHAAHLDGATEVRPGVFVFGDLFQAAIGSCAEDDIAVSVLASVISRRAGAARTDAARTDAARTDAARTDAVWTDAGALALTQDRSLDDRLDDLGGAYGGVCDLELRPLGARVDRLSQEHGRVVGPQSSLQSLVPGSRVRILPNHSCLTSAMFDRYHVVEDGRAVAEWPRLRG